MWTTRLARGWTAGSAATCSASKTPRTLSFPSCERFAASAKRANATRIQQHRQAKAHTPSFRCMDSSAGDAATESILPGRADTARPGGGVWLTDASLVLVAIIWGVNFSIVKFGTSLIDPLAYNGVRVLLAAVLLLAIALASRGPLPSPREIAVLLALGVLGNGVYQVFFVEGVARTRASDAGLVIAASPAFIAIVGRMFGVERVSRRGVMGIAMSIGGIAFVVLGTTNATTGDATIVGDLLVLTGSLCWAFYTVMLKPYTEHLSGLHVSAFTMLGGAIPLALLASSRIAATHWSQLPAKGWSAIL